MKKHRTTKTLLEAGAFIAGVSFLAYLIGGCASSKGPTRDQAASVVVGLSSAVKIVDHACALTAIETSSYALAERCAVSYGAAREALLASALGLDVWDEDKSRSACAILEAVNHVNELGGANAEVSAVLSTAALLALPLCKTGAKSVQGVSK